jgi:cytochrome c biogenesis protein CcmG/thiol:disulfide interchange protein DsbE
MPLDTPTRPEPDDASVEVLDGRGRHTARWISVVVGLVLAGFVAFLFTVDGGERSNDSPLLGELVPPVTGETLAGETYDIDDHRGQWVAVNFFASWCGPCRQEHPELVAFADEHAAAGDASVVSVAFDDQQADAEAFFEELGGDWPVLVSDTAGIGVDFGVTGVPETYLVAPDGTVVAKWAEPITAAAIDQVIAQYAAGGAGS